MPMVTTRVATPVRRSFRVHQVAGMFDLPLPAMAEETFSAEAPGCTEAWRVGAIVGPSGSGKSTIARAAYGEALLSEQPWPRDAAVIDGLGEGSIRTLTRMLGAVGFNSPPAWLRPYGVLSNGERFRADLARALLSGRPLVVVDEFTSLVDRTVAKAAAAAVAKAVRARWSSVERFVAITCHYDVLEWLAADWVLDMATGRLARGGLRRPAISLCVVRARQQAWERFARHHYLTGGLSRGATCYVALWNETPVAFCAVIGLLGRRGWKRVTRLVTLPEYQGLGIGTRLLEFVCQQIVRRGERASITTTHPALCAYLSESTRWNCIGVRRPRATSPQVMRAAVVRDSARRAVASFEFLG